MRISVAELGLTAAARGRVLQHRLAEDVVARLRLRIERIHNAARVVAVVAFTEIGVQFLALRNRVGLR